VVGAESPLVGRTLAGVGFRGRYAAVVLSIHRDGQPLTGRMGTTTLRPGDALLVLGDQQFAARWAGRDDFALLAPLPARRPGVDARRLRLTVVVVAVAVLLAAAADVGGRPGGVLAVVVATMLLTEPLSNAAAAALMLPVSLQVAAQLDGDPIAFAAGVAIAASTSFLTPIGYQTNTMVYGLGGYRFADYARLGVPLTVLSLVVVSVGVLSWAW
jgi:di/tricarboxylate transporter